MNDNEMLKLRSTKFSSSPQVHSFLFFVLEEAWVVWEVFSPSPKLSPPPEWIGWGGGYEYARDRGYWYDWGAGSPDDPPAGEEDIHMVGSHMVEDMNMMVKHYHPMNHRLEVAGMDMVEEHYHPMNHWSEVEGIDFLDFLES
jgi:hypothetical protein